MNKVTKNSTRLISMTQTRLALLSPAMGSRHCKASADLGRRPHVSAVSSTCTCLPTILPSFPHSAFRHSLNPLFPSFLTIHLHHPFLLYFLFLKICSFHIPSTHLPWRSQKASSLRRQPVAKPDSITAALAEELAALLQSPLPSPTSLALCSQHTSKPAKKGI